MSPRRDEPEVHRITAAPEPLAADVARRQRVYLIQMGARVVCFVLAIVLWAFVPLAVGVALIVAAVVLPSVAVLLANAGRERRDEPEPFVDPRMIGGGRGPGELGGGR